MTQPILFVPYKDNVFIELLQHDQKTAGGIHIPDSAVHNQFGKNMLEGKVVAAGAGGFDDKGVFWQVDVCEGDHVIIPHDAGQEVIVGESIPTKYAPGYEPGTELRVLRNNEILAVKEEV